MSFRSCRVGMWSPALTFLLFLILELVAQPGVSQGVKAPQICRECKGLLTETGVTQKFYQILVKRANYSACPNNIVTFKLPNKTYCGSKMESWVINLIKCIDQGRNPCLQSSESQQDFSKGSNEKPPTTNQESTSSTVRLVPSIRLSTQYWKEGTFKPTENTIEDLLSTQEIQKTTTDLTSRGLTTTDLTSTGLLTTAPDSDSNNSLLHGNETPNKVDEESKTKKMSIAIILLLLIVLGMTAVGTYFWCRKGKSTKCVKNFAEKNSGKYELTLLEEPDSIKG
ncbi:uncharacterized protein LOC142750237 [Rhinoderma darwinii]|uniref:uncharacterized protein LOC142750237 n=1 Tax=Rhinoderma darwinii TaxID=43563 RepID=UPI003F676B80